MQPMSRADIKAELARFSIQIYRLGAAIGVHPQRLARMLNGHAPLRGDVAVKIADFLRKRGSAI